jgi:4-hydroxy-2,2'-bipyrrole-5-methanol synthase
MLSKNERRQFSLKSYYISRDQDIFKKCADFYEAYNEMDQEGLLSDSHRVEIQSGLDAKIKVKSIHKSKVLEALCFDSNGYLGMQHHPKVKAAMKDAIDEFGAGTPSVPMLGGTNVMLKKLEQRLSKFHFRDDAMVFTSTYAANIGVIPAICRSQDIIFYDQKCHASLIQGIKIARCAETIMYNYNDPCDLEEKMKVVDAKGTRKGGFIVITDGVYSMEGDVLNLPAFRAVCDKFQARLIVDECHSVGVVGLSGRGVEDYFSMPGSIDLIIGCFSKALGFSGGYVVGSKEVIHYLRYFTSPYIFSTSLPSSICAGVTKALELIDEEPIWLKKLQENSHYLKSKVVELGFPIKNMEGAIVRIPLEDNKRMFEVGRELLAEGLKCGVVTYPAVTDHYGILRIVATARHEKSDIDQAIKILKKVLSKYQCLKFAHAS